jgi:tRNA-binding protein
MKEQITFDDFDKVDIRVGTVISVRKNEKARKPSLVVEVDFGEEIGIKQSSAQITHYYNEENLRENKSLEYVILLKKILLGSYLKY